MRVGKCSLRHANSWSPPSRDPRYSRRTPDKLPSRSSRPRLVYAAAPRATRLDTTLWAARILHAKARKCLVYDNKRAHLLSVLKKKAEAADTAPANTTLEVNVDSSVYEAPVALLETVSVMPRQRAIFAPVVVYVLLAIRQHMYVVATVYVVAILQTRFFRLVSTAEAKWKSDIVLPNSTAGRGEVPDAHLISETLQ
jgi:hypothetical protein